MVAWTSDVTLYFLSQIFLFLLLNFVITLVMVLIWAWIVNFLSKEKRNKSEAIMPDSELTKKRSKIG